MTQNLGIFGPNLLPFRYRNEVKRLVMALNVIFYVKNRFFSLSDIQNTISEYLYLSCGSGLTVVCGTGSSPGRFRFLCCGNDGINFGSQAVPTNTNINSIQLLIDILRNGFSLKYEL